MKQPYLIKIKKSALTISFQVRQKLIYPNLLWEMREYQQWGAMKLFRKWEISRPTLVT